MSRSELHLVEEDLEGERLDAFLAEMVTDLSRTAVKDLITSGQVLVDGESRKPSYRIKEGLSNTVRPPVPWYTPRLFI